MNILTKHISRFLFAIPMLLFGVFHFMNASDMAGIIPQWLPFPVFWVILTGIALVGAAISIIIQVWDYWASFLLGLMLLVFVLTIHLPAALDGAEPTSLLKDLALVGGAWFYTGYIAKKAE